MNWWLTANHLNHGMMTVRPVSAVGSCPQHSATTCTDTPASSTNPLQEIIESELARRENREDMRPALWFVSCDEPGALMDVDEAVKVIVERADNDLSGKPVYVSRSIEKAVMDALHVGYPKRWSICNQVVSPGQPASLYARPDLELEPDRDADATERAAARIAEMRDPKSTHWGA
jgi:hypothetical protein